MILNSQFQYPSLTRTIINEKRHYSDGSFTPLPSVTTILSSFAKGDALVKWIERLGEEEADRIRNQSADVGSKMHENIENYVLHGTKPTGRPLEVILSKLIIDSLKDVDEAWGIESALYYPEKYAGTTDMVGVYKGKPAIIDFKNSRKFKNPKFLEDYKCQIVAYGLAHNQMFGTDINTGVILIARWDGVLQRVHIEPDEFLEYEKIWLGKVNQYFESINNIS